ncbi:SEC14-like protein 2 [Trichonephila clavipes]|nr:SEC14-like protein 2 [Trichonephila clavipes]
MNRNSRSVGIIGIRGMELFLFGIGLFLDNYPEILKSVYVLNASSYFTLVFPLVKTILSGSILNKITIFGKDGYKEELLKIMDAETLPAFLGGKKTDPDGNPRCETFPWLQVRGVSQRWIELKDNYMSPV